MNIKLENTQVATDVLQLDIWIDLHRSVHLQLLLDYMLNWLHFSVLLQPLMLQLLPASWQVTFFHMHLASVNFGLF